MKNKKQLMPVLNYISKLIVSSTGSSVYFINIVPEGLTIGLSNVNCLKNVIGMVYKGLGLKFYLMDLCVADYPNYQNRFKLVYSFLSYNNNIRLNVIIFTNEFTPVDSLVEFYDGINWLEREAWDMYGVCFNNHPDLRRVFTDYGFDGFPLRKDFPLSGFLELKYDSIQKRITYNPISLSQEGRFYEFNTPWFNKN